MEIAALVATVVLGLWGIYYARRSAIVTDQQNQKSEVSVTVLDEDAKLITYVFDRAPTDKDVVITELVVAIACVGPKTVNDIAVSIECSEMIMPADLPIKVEGDQSVIQVGRVSYQESNTKKTRVTYKIPALNPKLAIPIHDLLVWRGLSRQKMDVPLELSDGNVNLGVELVFGFDLKVSVTARDLEPSEFNLTIFGFEKDDPYLVALNDPGKVIEVVEENIKDFKEAEDSFMIFVDSEAYEEIYNDPEVGTLNHFKVLGAKCARARKFPEGPFFPGPV